MEESAEELGKEKRAIDVAIQEELHNLGENIVADINDNIQTEGHVVTGQTLSHSKIFSEEYHAISVGNDAPWIGWLEDGRPEVRAKPGGVLAFIPKGGTEVIFRTKVGPAEPTHVVERAVIKNTEQFTDIVAKRLEENGN